MVNNIHDDVVLSTILSAKAEYKKKKIKFKCENESIHGNSEISTIVVRGKDDALILRVDAMGIRLLGNIDSEVAPIVAKVRIAEVTEDRKLRCKFIGDNEKPTYRNLGQVVYEYYSMQKGKGVTHHSKHWRCNCKAHLENMSVEEHDAYHSTVGRYDGRLKNDIEYENYIIRKVFGSYDIYSESLSYIFDMWLMYTNDNYFETDMCLKDISRTQFLIHFRM